MYGEGNSSKLVGDIIGSTTKITDGLTEATGVDIRSLLAGFLGGKMAAPRAAAPAVEAAPAEEAETFKESTLPDDNGSFFYDSDNIPD
jgi:flotillin